MLRYCVFLLGLVCGVGNAAIADCSNGASVFQLTTLSLTPDPPVRNQNLDMGVIFTNPGGEVTDGTVTTSVTLNWIPFQPTVEPLCTNTQCPLVNGVNDRSTSSVWPDSVSGNVVSKIEWTGVDGSQLLCIKISTKVAGERNGTYLRGGLKYNTDDDATELVEALRLNREMDISGYESDDYGMNQWALFVPEEWKDVCFEEDKWYEEFMSNLQETNLSIGWTNTTLNATEPYAVVPWAQTPTETF